MTTKQAIHQALVRIGVVKAGNLSDPYRWSATDLATDLADELAGHDFIRAERERCALALQVAIAGLEPTPAREPVLLWPEPQMSREGKKRWFFPDDLEVRESSSMRGRFVALRKGEFLLDYDRECELRYFASKEDAARALGLLPAREPGK